MIDPWGQGPNESWWIIQQTPIAQNKVHLDAILHFTSTTSSGKIHDKVLQIEITLPETHSKMHLPGLQTKTGNERECSNHSMFRSYSVDGFVGHKAGKAPVKIWNLSLNGRLDPCHQKTMLVYGNGSRGTVPTTNFGSDRKATTTENNKQQHVVLTS